MKQFALERKDGTSPPTKKALPSVPTDHATNKSPSSSPRNNNNNNSNNNSESPRIMSAESSPRSGWVGARAPSSPTPGSPRFGKQKQTLFSSYFIVLITRSPRVATARVRSISSADQVILFVRILFCFCFLFFSFRFPLLVLRLLECEE
jgi:hypothetical protein